MGIGDWGLGIGDWGLGIGEIEQIHIAGRVDREEEKIETGSLFLAEEQFVNRFEERALQGAQFLGFGKRGVNLFRNVIEEKEFRKGV